MSRLCPFCRGESPVMENAQAYALYDRYPVNEGHMLIIPKRHYVDFFESRKEERDAIFDLIWQAKDFLDERFKPDAYNNGVNCGISPGQTIMHSHVHLIPRDKSDVDDPIGSVRGVIPAKQKYPPRAV
jgi:diadenosine tetraphosphate (Ap4A) HIT family hydrolase